MQVPKSALYAATRFAPTNPSFKTAPQASTTPFLHAYRRATVPAHDSFASAQRNAVRGRPCGAASARTAASWHWRALVLAAAAAVPAGRLLACRPPRARGSLFVPPLLFFFASAVQFRCRCGAGAVQVRVLNHKEDVSAHVLRPPACRRQKQWARQSRAPLGTLPTSTARSRPGRRCT